MDKASGTLATAGTSEGSQFLRRVAFPGVEFDQPFHRSFHLGFTDYAQRITGLQKEGDPCMQFVCTISCKMVPFSCKIMQNCMVTEGMETSA